MSLDQKTAARVAGLAHLEMEEAELQAVAPKLDNILHWIEQLAEVDTDNVEPLANVVNVALKQRKDEVTDGGYPEKVLANAPEQLEGFFVVPKIVEQED